MHFGCAFLESVDHFLVCEIMEGSGGLVGESMGRGVCIGFFVRKPGPHKESSFVLGLCDLYGVSGVITWVFEGGHGGLVNSSVPGVKFPEVGSWLDQAGELFGMGLFDYNHLVVELFSGHMVAEDGVLGYVLFHLFVCFVKIL